MPIFATQPPQTTNEIVADSLRKPQVEVVAPMDSAARDSSKTVSWNDALAISKEAADEKYRSINFNLGTAQAGMTTNGNLKDRLVVSGGYKDDIYYKGLYEAFQDGESLLQSPFLKNEISLPCIGSDHYAPISVLKIAEDEGELRLYDKEFGIVNKSLPEALRGSGRVYVTTDIKNFTTFFSYGRELKDGIVAEVTGQGVFGRKKPNLYIEGELQKYFDSGIYVFIRGEVDNQGVENKAVFGIGYTPSMRK